MFEPVWFLLACAFFGGMLAVLLFLDAVRCVRRRWRCRRPPVTHGKVDLFDDAGEGAKPYLSARLPIGGLVRLIDDVNRGRFG
jgi:hypothetical protein